MGFCFCFFRGEICDYTVLGEHFKKMPQIWADYLSFQETDTIAMMREMDVDADSVDISRLLHKSKGRVVELNVFMIKVIRTGQPPQVLEQVQADLELLMEKLGAHPSLTGIRQLHLPLSSPLTGTTVANTCLWLCPTRLWRDRINPHQNWSPEQRHGLRGMHMKHFLYSDFASRQKAIEDARHLIQGDEHATILCLVIIQDESSLSVGNHRASVSQIFVDMDAVPSAADTQLQGPFRGLDQDCSCTVLGQHNVDELLLLANSETNETAAQTINALSDELRKLASEAHDQQALTVLARGEVYFEHVFELEERQGSSAGWQSSTNVVIRRGLVKKQGGANKTKWQQRLVELSTSGLK